MITAFLVLATAYWLFGALMHRARLRALPRLTAAEPSGDDGDDDYVLFAAPGVSLDAAAQRAVFADARARGLELVDLVPAQAPAWRLSLFAGAAETTKPTRAFTLLASAGYALAVSRQLLTRSAQVWRSPRSPAEVASIAFRLSPYGHGKLGWVVVSDLRVPASDPPAARRDLANRHMRGMAGSFLFIHMFFYLAVPVAAWFAPWPGLVALLALHAAPLLIFVGAPARPGTGELIRQTLLRLPLELGESASVMLAWRSGEDPEAVGERRAAYADVDPATLFEPRRESCPMCGATELVLALESPDTVQHKPGGFALDRCAGCGHVFQNPRLSLAGLDYYYRDAYDGLSGEDIEAAFAFQVSVYDRRVHAIDGLGTPTRWLDVGGGHGHFSQVVRETYPGIRIDGLDLSESIDDAAKRGWIDKAYRGLFTSCSEALAGEGYDVLSMNHYLEHTLDPSAEIVAARHVLVDGGLFLIEVPNPESRFAAWLGSYWGPWLQPQHLHFVTAGNLDKLLRAHGFEPLRCQFREAHMTLDLFSAVWTFFQRVAPPVHQPWLPPPEPMDFVRRDLVLAVGLPLMGLAAIGDQLLRPLIGGARWTNTYRVVARKRAGAVEAG